MTKSVSFLGEKIRKFGRIDYLLYLPSYHAHLLSFKEHLPLMNGKSTDHGNVEKLSCGCKIVWWQKAGRDFQAIPECLLHNHTLK